MNQKSIHHFFGPGVSTKTNGIIGIRYRGLSMFILLLMEEIRTSWYGEYPIIYMVLSISGGAGFHPSTVGMFFSYSQPGFLKTPGRLWRKLHRWNVSHVGRVGSRGRAVEQSGQTALLAVLHCRWLWYSLGGGFKYCIFIFTPNFGGMIHFDKFFQMGGNHQLD